MKKVEKSKYINHHQFVHLFANGKRNGKSSTGTMSIEDNVLYYENRPIAIIYSRVKKIVFIDIGYDNKGGFGNGLDYYDVVKAFPDDWNTVSYPIQSFNGTSYFKGYTYCKSTDKASKKNETFIKIIKQYVDLIVGCKVHLDSVIYDREMYNNHHYGMLIKHKSKFKEVKEILNIPNKLLNIKVKERIVRITHYTGWSNTSYNKFINNFKYKDYLIDCNLTDVEKEILDAKNWIHAYIYNTNRGSRLTKAEKFELYRDVDCRKKVESQAIEIERQKEEQRNKQLEKEIAEDRLRIEDWCKNEYSRLNYRIPEVYLRFRKNNVETIETSHNASVPTSHAKLLYRKFKQCIDTDTIYIANGSSIKIGYFLVERITKTDDGRWYLKAGCHYIYKKEIDKFILDNNLDW